MNTYQQFIVLASQFSVFMPLTIYLLRIRDVRRPTHSVGMLVLVSGICDLVGFTLVGEKLSTAFVLNAFILFQFFLLSHYYYGTLFRGKPDTVLGITMWQYATGFLIVTVFYDEFRGEHLNALWAISSAILILYSVLYFRKIIKHYQAPRIYTCGNFWINNAIFVYLSLSLWLFAIRSDVTIGQWSGDTYQTLWSFYRINNVLKNVMFALGIYYSLRRSLKTPAVAGLTSEA